MGSATRRSRHRRRGRRWVVAAAVLAAAGAGLLLAGTRGGDSAPGAAGFRPPQTRPSGSAPATIRRRLAVRAAGRLPMAVADAAAAAVGRRVYVLGGLTAGGASTTAISSVRNGRSRAAGRLPVAVHDAAAAATSAGRVLVLGGGQTASFSGVGSYDPASGHTRIVGRLPTPLSDLATATVDGTVYAVGGFTGSAASDRVLRYRAGRATTVARLPHPVRYAAVAAQGSSLVIAGGRVGDAPSDAVYRFTPSSGELHRIGTLPRPLMHAAAAQLDGTVYVVGGIGQNGSPLPGVTAIDADGHVHVAAQLPAPRSDAAVVASGGRLLVLGGSDGVRPLASILEICWRRQRQRSTTAAETPPRRFRGPLPGDLLIADRGNDRLLLVDPRHRVLWRYPSRPGQHRLVFDDDAFFTPGGHSIISNEEDNQQIVQISYPAGRLVWSYGHAGVPGSGPGYLDTPDDAYRLRGGMVIVSDDRNCRILELRGHHVVRSIGRPGNCVHDPPRGFASPNGDTPLPDGHLLVSEIGGSWVDELTLTGKLVRALHVPVSYPSDPQLTANGNIVVADYSHPGGVVIVDRHSGRLLWSYRPSSGPGELDHPSLATMLPNGKLMVVDDYNDRIVIIDRRTRRIVWQYGHRGVGGTAQGYLHIPDGFDFVPVTPDGQPDPAAIVHGR